MFGSKRLVHAKVSQVRLLPKPLHATAAAEQAVRTDQLMPTPAYHLNTDKQAEQRCHHPSCASREFAAILV